LWQRRGLATDWQTHALKQSAQNSTEEEASCKDWQTQNSEEEASCTGWQTHPLKQRGGGGGGASAVAAAEGGGDGGGAAAGAGGGGGGVDTLGDAHESETVASSSPKRKKTPLGMAQIELQHVQNVTQLLKRLKSQCPRSLLPLP
jgi:hypothetical protein